MSLPLVAATKPEFTSNGPKVVLVRNGIRFLETSTHRFEYQPQTSEPQSVKQSLKTLSARKDSIEKAITSFKTMLRRSTSRVPDSGKPDTIVLSARLDRLYHEKGAFESCLRRTSYESFDVDFLMAGLS